VASFRPEMATSTLSAALAAASNATRATPQGGILEGENPTIYDMKNPVIIFIIQVSSSPTRQQPRKSSVPSQHNQFIRCRLTDTASGWHNPNFLPPPSLPPLPHPSAPSHRRSNRWHPPWALRVWPHPPLQRHHLPARRHAES
jgi:hypothetical protein